MRTETLSPRKSHVMFIKSLQKRRKCEQYDHENESIHCRKVKSVISRPCLWIGAAKCVNIHLSFHVLLLLITQGWPKYHNGRFLFRRFGYSGSPCGMK